MSDRRGNVSRSYFNRLLRRELVHVENAIYGAVENNQGDAVGNALIDMDNNARDSNDGSDSDDGDVANMEEVDYVDDGDANDMHEVGVGFDDAGFGDMGGAQLLDDVAGDVGEPDDENGDAGDMDEAGDRFDDGELGHMDGAGDGVIIYDDAVGVVDDENAGDMIEAGERFDDYDLREADYVDAVVGEDTSDGNDSGSDDGSDDEVGESFKSELAKIVIQHKFSREATNQILKLLISNGHEELPKTRETLLHTPSVPIVPRVVYPGEYLHIGLKKCLKRCNFEFLIHQEIIEIDISVDGLSLSKSSKLKVWPILGAFPNTPNTSPFIIGAYVGYADPKSIDEFLQDFVEEVRNCMENGVEVTPQMIHKPFRIRAYICDAPARAFLTGTKSFLANIGCNKCDQHCVKVGTTKTFQTTQGNLRTDESFRRRDQVGHHQPEFVEIPSLLETIGTRMVTQVPNDPMHLVDEGVFAKMLGTLFFETCRSVRVQPIAKQLMDNMYIAFAPYVPSEFSRKTRSIINEFTRWKGTEYRFWGLYGGFIVLKDFAGPELYKHFLLLFTAIRLLACSETHLEYTDYCQTLLETFVETYGDIYNPEDLVYNLHGLLHIIEDVKLYGPLYSYSAYRFENHMREIKKLVKKPNMILQQLSKRLEEINFANENNERDEENGFVGLPRPYDSDLFPGCTTSYKSFKYNDFILKNNLRDSCCLLNSGQAVEIKHFLKIDEREVIVCKRFMNARNFFTEPCESLNGLGIMLVNGLSDEEEAFDLTEVKYKLVRLPYHEFFVLIPMIHQI